MSETDCQSDWFVWNDLLQAELACLMVGRRNNVAQPGRINIWYKVGLERYQKYTRYPIPNSIAFVDADTDTRY